MACSIFQAEVLKPFQLFPLDSDHPGVELRANLKSMSHRCHLFEVAFLWELTQETIHLPLGCLQGGAADPMVSGSTSQPSETLSPSFLRCASITESKACRIRVYKQYRACCIRVYQQYRACCERYDYMSNTGPAVYDTSVLAIQGLLYTSIGAIQSLPYTRVDSNTGPHRKLELVRQKEG